jgi:hypothetical protein
MSKIISESFCFKFFVKTILSLVLCLPQCLSYGSRVAPFVFCVRVCLFSVSKTAGTLFCLNYLFVVGGCRFVLCFLLENKVVRSIFVLSNLRLETLAHAYATTTHSRQVGRFKYGRFYWREGAMCRYTGGTERPGVTERPGSTERPIVRN